MKTNRYPGVKPFETGEQDRFFGRDRDIADLYDLILLEKLVVLFGKSGYGKSSLLNAGIIPRLDEEQDPALRYHTLVVRIGPYVAGQNTLSPVANIQQRLQDRFPLAEGEAEALAAILKPLSGKPFKQRQMAGGPRRYLLVFDQFEEFFFYPPEERQRFKEQLTELLYQAIPQRVREQSSALPREQRQLIASPLEVKAIFAIREDRLSLLDTLKDFLPAILHQRYELRALSREQAQQAIVCWTDCRAPGVQQQQIEAFCCKSGQFPGTQGHRPAGAQNLIRVSDLPQ
ncbi:MAG: NACHT domain-containing protein [Haliscomenobacter sp.]|nr:NACHT domain-containing protein [Haliscomenobacter sp.]MBK9492290.1 NACHT domain-containing protein [Haliscomenobacter sp.]